MAETSCNQLLIDTAMTLLLINSPTVKSIAMSLYNITDVFLQRVIVTIARVWLYSLTV